MENEVVFGKEVSFDVQRKISLRIVLNPFAIFSAVWILVPLVHLMDLTLVYPALDVKTGLFLFAMVLISIGLAFFYDRKFLKERQYVFFENSKPSYLLIIALYVMTVLECIYSKQVPLFNIRKSMSSYKDFGIPMVSFFVNLVFFALDGMSSVKLIYGDKESFKGNLLVVFLTWFRFVLLYSRGNVLICVLITALVFLSRQKLTHRLVILMVLAALIGLLGFNALGNIRMNSKWNDSSQIIAIAQIRPQYYWLSSFSWDLVYIDTPLGNLLYNIKNVPPEYSASGLLSQLLPDFLSKRIFPQYDSSLFLAIENLTVSSMFAGGYKYGGYFGMFLSFVELCAFILLFAYLTKDSFKEFLAVSASLSVAAFMSFFDNPISVSGCSFFVVFLFLFKFFDPQSISPESVQKLAMLFKIPAWDILSEELD